MRRLIRSFRLRLRSLVYRRQLERDLQDELAYHLEQRNRDGKTTPSFGNATLVHEECREVWSFRHIENLWRDTLHALRVLGRTPAHTLSVVLVLGIGIGANAAIF